MCTITNVIKMLKMLEQDPCGIPERQTAPVSARGCESHTALQRKTGKSQRKRKTLRIREQFLNFVIKSSDRAAKWFNWRLDCYSGPREV